MCIRDRRHARRGRTAGCRPGYFRGKTDGFIGLLTDSLLAFPALILLLAVVSALDPTVTTISLVLALLTIPAYVRLARANTLVFAQREFVLAARSVGASHWRIIFRELAPNVVRPLLAYGSIIIAVLIVAEASLSYLGVGIQPPTPTWGNMISSGQTELETTPHLIFVPGIGMFLTVLALNRVGDWARAKASGRTPDVRPTRTRAPDLGPAPCRVVGGWAPLGYGRLANGSASNRGRARRHRGGGGGQAT